MEKVNCKAGEDAHRELELVLISKRMQSQNSIETEYVDRLANLANRILGVYPDPVNSEDVVPSSNGVLSDIRGSLDLREDIIMHFSDALDRLERLA